MNTSFFVFFFLVICAGIVLKVKSRAPLNPRPHQPPEMTPTYAAWLAGGAKRVAETWWTDLSRCGFLGQTDKPKKQTINRGVQLGHLDTPTRQAAHAFRGETTLSQDKILSAWRDPIDQVRQEMERSGWINPTKEVANRDGLRGIYMALSLVAVVVGIAYWNWTIWPSLFALATASVFTYLIPKQPRLTHYGTRKLQELQAEHRSSILAPQKDTMVMAVALGGSIALVGTPWQPYASPAQTQKNTSSDGGCGSFFVSWGDGDGGCGSSSSSGCGGGGCGGD